MRETDRQYLLELAQCLDDATRMGAKRDVPEGACYAAFSDTLLKQISQRLREIAGPYYTEMQGHEPEFRSRQKEES